MGITAHHTHMRARMDTRMHARSLLATQHPHVWPFLSHPTALLPPGVCMRACYRMRMLAGCLIQRGFCLAERGALRSYPHSDGAKVANVVSAFPCMTAGC